MDKLNSITFPGLEGQYTIPQTASDVGARPDNWMPTASDVGAVPANYATATANNSYHTAHFAKIGKLVICTILPKALNSNKLSEETITIPDGFRPATVQHFEFFSDTAKNAGDANGVAVINANATGTLYFGATYQATVAEFSRTLCWATA